MKSKYSTLPNSIQQHDQFTSVLLHTFNGPLSGTTQVSRYQKGKTNPNSTEARDSESQWHQLGHMQVCTSLQTDNHASTPPLSFYRPVALPSAQPTVSKHWQTYIHSLVYQQMGELKWIKGNRDAYSVLKVHKKSIRKGFLPDVESATTTARSNLVLVGDPLYRCKLEAFLPRNKVNGHKHFIYVFVFLPSVTYRPAILT